MKSKGDLAPRTPAKAWTRPDDYLGALARRRTFRKSREPGPRTEPESPRFLLSTLPFLVLFGALAVIAAGIIVAAWPATTEPRQRAAAETREPGTAQKGWFQEAQKDFRNSG